MIDGIERICVTGGAGFIGSHLVRKLLQSGYDVLVIDDLSVGLRENIPQKAEFLLGDILDTDVADRVASCDAVVHLAARVAIRSSFEFMVEDTRANVVGTANLLRALGLAKRNSVKKFIFASSMAVYGESAAGEFVAETHSIAPLSPYGVSKYAAEMLVRQVCEQTGVDAAILRLFNTYGKGQILSPYVGVATIFANAMKSGDSPTIFGDGLQCRDFVHVEDIVQGFVRALAMETRGKVYNIGSGVGYTINDVYRAIANAVDFQGDASYAEAVPGELRFSVADISKARTELGYDPAHSFAESIGSVVGTARGDI